jgi:hypothetical protein
MCRKRTLSVPRGVSDLRPAKLSSPTTLPKLESSRRRVQLGINTSSPLQSVSLLNLEGESMGNLANALQQLRAERREAQSHVEKLDKAISVIESLNGTGASGRANQPTATVAASASPSAPKRFISKASRRKMALAQKARWARAKKESQPVLVSSTAKTSSPAPVKRVMSAAARRKIAAFQRARWAKLKAGQKKAA